MQQVYESQYQAYLNQPFMPIDVRQSTIVAIKKWLQSNTDRIAHAIAQDFGHRSHDETKLLEVYSSIQAANYALKNLKRWMKPRKRHVAWQLLPAKACLIPQPLGVVGIIVPWNYPLFLAVSPLIAALAAGNRVMLKMSEFTPKLGELMVTMMHECHITPSHISIINGDVDVAKEFTEIPFKHLLFTGATHVGKLVMQAASKNLTPVTLELGGKSPSIISKRVDRKLLSRLLMAKAYNAGQTCVAPDYLMIPHGMEDDIQQLLQQALNKHYPNYPDTDDYTCIVNDRHYERLTHLLDDAKAKGAQAVSLADKDGDGRKMPLTLVFNVTDDMAIMQHEIFGPLLPVISYSDFDEVIERIKLQDNPLALYYFGEDKEEIERLKHETMSGSLVLNDAMMHVAIDDLPFGGVGASGMGCYHGVEGFNLFSHLKPVMTQSKLSQLSVIYPPYGKLSKLFLKYLGGIR